MSWQLTMRWAGVAVTLALLTAGCSTPQRTTGQAAQGTGAAPRPSVNAVQAPAAASATPVAQGTPVHTASPASSPTHRAAAPTASSTPPGTSPAGSRFRPRLGVYAAGMPRSYWPAERFGAAVGKRPGIALFYTGFGEHFPASFARQAHAHGAVPLDQIQPTGISVAQVAAGRYDSYLKSYADQVRAYGHRVIIGFAHEMNGSWYSWGWTHVSPRTWILAWRRLVNDFRSQHADNVTWLWTISRVLDQGPVRSFWPGASYVNWVGIDGYYSVATDTFSTVFLRMMHIVRQFTHDPILISESAIGQRAGQARKIPNLLAGVVRYHLRGLVWFDVAQSGGLSQQDWRLEGHPSALAAFRKADRGFA